MKLYQLVAYGPMATFSRTNKLYSKAVYKNRHDWTPERIAAFCDLCLYQRFDGDLTYFSEVSGTYIVELELQEDN